MKSTIQCVVLVIVVLALVYVNSFTHFFPQRLTLKGLLLQSYYIFSSVYSDLAVSLRFHS